MSLPKKVGKLNGFSFYVFFEQAFIAPIGCRHVAAVLVMFDVDVPLRSTKTFCTTEARRRINVALESFKCFRDEANNNILTSDANANLFFSPPEIPLTRPGVPMTVSAQFFRPS